MKDHSATADAAKRLDSWKEIAAYFNRDVRTVRRWESELGLPIHRRQHTRRGIVYAYAAELDAWWKAGSKRSEKVNATPAGGGWRSTLPVRHAAQCSAPGRRPGATVLSRSQRRASV